MVKKPLILTFGAALFLSGAGCGGSDSSSGPSTPSNRTGMTFTVTWPKNGRFIAKNANKVVVTIDPADAAVPDPAPLVFYRNPPAGLDDYSDTQTTGELPAGSYAVTANSYFNSTTGPGNNGENPLSTGSQNPVVVTSNNLTPIQLSLNPTLADVQVQFALPVPLPVPFVLPGAFVGETTVTVDDPTAPDTISLSKAVGTYRVYVTPRSGPTNRLLLFNDAFLGFNSSDTNKMDVTKTANDIEQPGTATHSRTLTLKAAAAPGDEFQLRVNYTDNNQNNSGNVNRTFRVPIVVAP